MKTLEISGVSRSRTQQALAVSGSPQAALLALLALLAAEAICFGPVVRHVGLYLDDWWIFCILKFAPHSFAGLVSQLFADPRITIRPLEPIVYALPYLLFGAKPLAHHVVNAAVEVASAWFLYLAMARLSGNPAISLLASFIFLLYPAHDVTHYWIGASAITVSLALYNASLWQSVKGSQDKKSTSLLLSVLLFAASVFSYESFMPFSILNAVCVFIVYGRTEPRRRSAAKAGLYLVPYLAVILAMWFYRQKLLPALGIGFTQHAHFKLDHAWEVISRGTAVFGGIGDQRRHAPTGPDTKTLILEGAAVFGGVDVKN